MQPKLNASKILQDRYSRIFHRRMRWHSDAELAIAATHRVDLLMTRLKTQFFANFGLTSSAEFQVLTACYDYRDGFAQSDLVVTLEARPGTISALLKRLAEAQLIKVAPIAHLKRGNIVRITPKGIEVFERAQKVFLTWIPNLFDGIEIDHFVRLLASFEDRIKQLGVNEEFVSALYQERLVTEVEERRGK